jgi:hypothetical protein
MTRLDCRLADSALVLLCTGTESATGLLGADAATARRGPTACFGSGQILWSLEGGQLRLLQSVTIHFVLKDTQQSVVQAPSLRLPVMTSICCPYRMMGVEQRISGAEGPIGLTVIARSGRSTRFFWLDRRAFERANARTLVKTSAELPANGWPGAPRSPSSAFGRVLLTCGLLWA